jgi:hypothetical protein
VALFHTEQSEEIMMLVEVFRSRSLETNDQRHAIGTYICPFAMAAREYHYMMLAIAMKMHRDIKPIQQKYMEQS